MIKREYMIAGIKQVLKEKKNSIKRIVGISAVILIVTCMMGVNVVIPVSATTGYPTIIGVGYTTSTDNSTPSTVNLPSGSSAGDLCIVEFMTNNYNSSSVTTVYFEYDNEWEKIDSYNEHSSTYSLTSAIFYKILTDADITAGNIGIKYIGAAARTRVNCIVIEEGTFDEENPIGSYNHTTGTTTSASLSSLTIENDNSLLLFIGGIDSSSSSNTSSYDIENYTSVTITELFDNSYAGSTRYMQYSAFWADIEDSGSTGTVTYTINTTPTMYCGYLIAINPYGTTPETYITTTITDTQTVTNTSTVTTTIPAVTETATVTTTLPAVTETATVTTTLPAVTNTVTVTTTLSTVTETITSTIQTGTITNTVTTTLETATVTETETTALQTITETETTTVAELTETTTRTVIGEVDTGAMIDSWLLIAYIAVMLVVMILTVFYRNVLVRLIVVAMAMGLIIMTGLIWLQIGAGLIVCWQIYELLKDI
jgi:hypothetical protein